MARVIVGYDGGRPVFRDEGPARGRVGDRGGGDTISRLGAQVLPSRFLTGGDATHAEQDDGAGAIERRQMSDAERDARRRTDDAPSPIAPRRTETSLAASRARGAERAGFVRGATKPYLAARPAPVTEPDPPPPPREEIPVPASPPPPLPLALSQPAHGEPLDVSTPCRSCSHRVVCSIRARLEDDLVVVARFGDAEADPAIRVAAVSIECDHYVEESRTAAAPEPTRMRGGRIVSDRLPDPIVIEPLQTKSTSRGRAAERGARSPEELEARDRRAAKVLDLLERYDGNTKRVGDELGLRGNVVANIARTARLRAAAAAASA